MLTEAAWLAKGVNHQAPLFAEATITPSASMRAELAGLVVQVIYVVAFQSKTLLLVLGLVDALDAITVVPSSTWNRRPTPADAV